MSETENAKDTCLGADSNAPSLKLSKSPGKNNKSTSGGEDQHYHLSLRPHCTPCRQFLLYTNTETHSSKAGSKFREEMTQELIN